MHGLLPTQGCDCRHLLLSLEVGLDGHDDPTSLGQVLTAPPFFHPVMMKSSSRMLFFGPVSEGFFCSHAQVIQKMSPQLNHG